MTVGYSGTPLAKKLGIKPDSTLAVVGEVELLLRLLELPRGVTVRESLRGKADISVVFVRRRRELERKIDAAARQVFPGGAVWVAWPKRASGVATDVTEDVVRDVVLPRGLVDVKVAAVDEVWSGLKCSWRRENRS